MFIGRFLSNKSGTWVREEVVECFTQGCCYWFAYILKARFGREYGAEIVSDYIVGHFGTRIAGRVYLIGADNGSLFMPPGCSHFGDHLLGFYFTENIKELSYEAEGYRCGNKIPLDWYKLKPMYAQCACCENKITYRTNISDETTEIIASGARPQSTCA